MTKKSIRDMALKLKKANPHSEEIAYMAHLTMWALCTDNLKEFSKPAVTDIEVVEPEEEK